MFLSWLLLVPFLFASSLGAPLDSTKNNQVPMLDGRIIGGYPVDITDYPYQLSLQTLNRHICGASLLSYVWVLTAAHCVTDNTLSWTSVRAGTSIRNSGGTNRAASAVYYHGYYDSVTADYDIALVNVASGIAYKNGIQPIALAYLNQYIPAGTMAVVTGWGDLVEGSNQGSNQLQAVNIPVVTNQECSISYSVKGLLITDRMLCAGYPAGSLDACQGDSGGPLVANNIQIGVVSWGDGCARQSFYGVYASIPNLRSWITQVTGI